MMRTNKSIAAGVMLAGLAGAVTVRADMVTDWNENLEKAVKVAVQLFPIEVRIVVIV